MKIIKRSPNSTVCVEPVKLNLEVDSAYRLNSFANTLKIPREDIIEYLLEVLYVTKIPLATTKDLYAIDNGFMLIKNPIDNCVYKLLKVNKDENLPK